MPAAADPKDLLNIVDEIDTVRGLINAAHDAANTGSSVVSVLRVADEELTAARDALNVYRGAPTNPVPST